MQQQREAAVQLRNALPGLTSWDRAAIVRGVLRGGADNGRGYHTLSMNCPHVGKLKHLKSIDFQISAASCQDCRSTAQLWFCVVCGYRGCGRYARGHALQHYQKTKHPVVLDLGNTACHWYDSTFSCISG